MPLIVCCLALTTEHAHNIIPSVSYPQMRKDYTAIISDIPVYLSTNLLHAFLSEQDQLCPICPPPILLLHSTLFIPSQVRARKRVNPDSTMEPRLHIWGSF